MEVLIPKQMRVKINFILNIIIISILGALRLYFEKFGPVDGVSLVCEPSGKSRGYGFVTFQDLETVDKVLKQIHVIDLRQVCKSNNYAKFKLYFLDRC